MRSAEDLANLSTKQRALQFRNGLIIALLAGPVVLGVYAVASKFAELLRLLPTAFNWVLYPSFAKQAPVEAWRRAAWLMPRAAACTAFAAIPLASVAGPVLPLLYGSDFAGAVLPSQLLLVGLTVEGAAGVVTAYLFGRGRPGLNSLATAGGVVVTVALDLLLIPRLSLLGGAVASSVAYLATTSDDVIVRPSWKVTCGRKWKV